MNVIQYVIKRQTVLSTEVFPWQKLATYSGDTLMVKDVLSNEQHPLMFETDFGLLIPNATVDLAVGHIATAYSGAFIGDFLRELPQFLADNQGQEGLRLGKSIEAEFNDNYFTVNLEDTYESLCTTYDAVALANRLAYLERKNA